MIIHENVKNIAFAFIHFSSYQNGNWDWHNSIAYRHANQTKSENICVIFPWFFDLNFRPDQRNNRSNLKREEYSPRGRLLSPNKRFTYEKCFVCLVVDLKVNLRAQRSNDLRWSHRFKKCFHVSKMANHPSEISSLVYIYFWKIIVHSVCVIRTVVILQLVSENWCCLWVLLSFRKIN